MANITVRPFTRKDIPGIAKIAIDNTFFYSAESLLSLAKLDPNALKVAVSQTGDVVAVIGFVKQNESCCFIGAFCVLEEYRGLGIGRKLWAAGIQHVGDRNMGLNCPTYMINAYKRRGFNVFEDSWGVFDHASYEHPNTELLPGELPGVEIKTLEECKPQVMFDYDLALVGHRRKAVLEANCNEKTSKTLLAFKNGSCVGYGTVKSNFFDAAHIGPLYADNSSVAELLLRRLLELKPNAKGLHMGIISSNLEANEFMQRLGIPINLDLFRMYTKEKMIVNTSKVFGVFSVDFVPF